MSQSTAKLDHAVSQWLAVWTNTPGPLEIDLAALRKELPLPGAHKLSWQQLSNSIARVRARMVAARRERGLAKLESLDVVDSTVLAGPGLAIDVGGAE